MTPIRSQDEGSVALAMAGGAPGDRPSGRAASDGVLRDQAGRPLGRRAVQTRNRLLEVTEALLSRRPLREISVADIARGAGTSPASFYQYFKNVEEAALELAERASEELPGFLARIDGSWEGDEGDARARDLVEIFLQHWDAHRAVLRLRNLASEEGDARFLDLRARSMVPVLDALEQRIAAAQASGRNDPALHPRAAAAAMVASLELLASYHAELELIGITREDLVSTTARILLRTITGRG